MVQAQSDGPNGDGPHSNGPHGEVAAWLDRLLERHPQYDADGVLDLRTQFLQDRGDGLSDPSSGSEGEGPARITDREEATRILRELRESYFEQGPGGIAAALKWLDLGKLPDLRSAAERLMLDEGLRDSYVQMNDDGGIDAELRRLLAGNVVLPWRERRRLLADFLTARQLGAKASPALRHKARKGAKRVAKQYPELDGLHGWWLRDVARLPRWNPLRGLFRAIRGWALNYLALLWLMMTFVFLFAGGALGHRVFLSLFQRFSGGPS